MSAVSFDELLPAVFQLETRDLRLDALDHDGCEFSAGGGDVVHRRPRVAGEKECN